MTNLTTRPRATERSAGTIFAPFHTNPDGAVASEDAATSPARTTGAALDADARTSSPDLPLEENLRAF